MQLKVNSCFWLLLAGFWLMHCPAKAENLVPSGDFEDETLAGQWAPPDQVSQTKEDRVSGDSALCYKGQTWAVSPELAGVDPQQSYVLQVFMKDSKGDLTVLLGLQLFDENGEQISSFSVAPIPGTEAVLLKGASEGDKVLHVEGNPWEPIPQTATAVAFDAKEDLSDLPNPRTAAIERIVAGNAGSFEVNLSSPLAQSYPAGTRVRQHRYADFPVMSFEPGKDWEAHRFEIGGVSEPGNIEQGKFWHGTRYVRPAFAGLIRGAASMASEEPIELLVDDLSLIRVD